MKKTIYAFCAILLPLCLCLTSKANNVTNSVCFNDGFYNWNISYTDAGGGNYTATGTVNVDGVNWSVYGWGSFANRMGTVEFHAANPNGDGCQGAYVDSFTYYGSAWISGNGQSTTFNGSGNWVNYCSGSPLFTGSWAANGPCGALKAQQYGPAKNKAALNGSTGKNGSNTVCFNDGFYNWNITYTDAGGGNYSATGSVNVDGVDWMVYGWGSFSNRMGNVEFHAANPNSDGCQGAYVDSFTYYGSAWISGNGQSTTFNGSGNWVNYCSGNQLFTGSWAANGPCGALKAQAYGPAKSKADPNAVAGKMGSNSVCFNDGFYNWNITYSDAGGGNYTATGSVNVDGVDWMVYGWGSFSNRMGTVEFHAANPNGDGCQGAYVDSFTYYGSAWISGNGQSTTFNGSGNWVNYCAGSELFTGTWSASGPCGALKSQAYGPAKNKANPNGLVSGASTNSVCFNDGFYNWKVSYTATGGGNYTAMGTVNVDGVDWSVYGWGNFANRMGTVEFHAANPNGDGCQGAYVDSFTYYGSAQLSGNGQSTTFTGGGNWVNYCSGSELFTGTWAASGPCGALKSQAYGPAKNATGFSLKVSPNPIKSTATVSYKLLKESQVKITIFNYMQQPVKVIVNKKEPAGNHSYAVDGSALMNGSYRVVAVVDGKSYSYALQVVK